MSEQKVLIEAAVPDGCELCGIEFVDQDGYGFVLSDFRIVQPALAQGDELFARRLQQLRDYAQWEKDNSPTDKQHILDWAVAALSAQREQPEEEPSD